MIPRPKDMSYLTYGELSLIPALRPPATDPHTDGLQFQVNGYLFEVSVTAKHLRDSLALGSAFVPPPHETLLLDAVTAYRSREYQVAVLYAAMSMEVALGSVIDCEYRRTLSNPSDNRYRIIVLEQAGGVKILKDPIYERLRNGDRFDTRLHELALYVLHRSLLKDDENLYRRAKVLYATRNKIAHTGVVQEPGKDDLLSADEGGAWEALSVSASLFSWLKLPKTVVLPRLDFVSPSDLL